MKEQSKTIIISELSSQQRRDFFIEKNYPIIYEDILKFNEKLKIKNFSKLLYHYCNSDIVYPFLCKICDKEVKFKGFNQGYNIYCSRKCSMNDDDIIKKRNKKLVRTNLEKYGVDNPMKLEKIQNKVRETNLKRYGTEYFTQTNEYKNKVKENNLRKYDTEWYMTTDDFKQKSKKTSLKKYNTTHSSKSIKVKNNIKKVMLEKYGEICYSKTNEYKNKMNQYYKSDKHIENIKRQKKNRDIKIFNYYDDYNINYKLINIYNDMLTYHCNLCNNNFEISKQLFYLRNKNKHKCCTICNPTDSKNISYKEKELYFFINENYDGNIIENYKDKFEIDIYLPDLNIGFEFNGLYWHSELYKDKNYHLEKINYFKEKNIHIIHIWEDDWIYKSDIIKSMILNRLNKSNIIYARKCIIEEIDDNKYIKKFLNENHLQGYVNSSIKIGLFINNELISLMTFGKSRDRKNNMELLRFCNKINYSVVGGFSKLLKYFSNNYKFEKIITYADKSYSDGNVYVKNNFKLIKETDPGYYWFKDGIKYNRFNFRKSELVKGGYDENKTENEIMHEIGFNKIYNCGNYKYELL